MHDLAFVFAGFFVGTVIGLTGVGGGSLMTPILIFFFGFKPHLSIGTALLFAAFTKLGGTVRLARAGLIDWPIMLQLSVGSIPASLLTLYVLHRVGPASAQVQSLMTTTLGCALLLTAAAILYKAVRGKAVPLTVAHDQEAKAATPRNLSLPLLFGALIGALVTLTSVGAGSIGITVLLILYPLLPLPRVVATDIAYAVPLTLVAGLGHASMGSVDWPLLAKLLAGSLPGIWIGSHMMNRINERVVRSLLSVLLAYAGLKLIAI